MKAPDDGVQLGGLHLRRVAVGRMPPDGRWLDKTLGLETQVSTVIVSPGVPQYVPHRRKRTHRQGRFQTSPTR